MKALIAWISWRRLRGRPLRSLLTLGGVAVGVAMIVTVSIVNDSIIESFRHGIETLSGEAAWEISAGNAGISEELKDPLEAVAGVRAAVPVVQSNARARGAAPASEVAISVLGVDPRLELQVRDYRITGQTPQETLLHFLARPDGVLLTQELSRKLGGEVGGEISLRTKRGWRPFPVLGVLEPVGPAKALGGNVAFLSLSAAQACFGQSGLVDRIEIVLEPDSEPATVRERLAALVGDRYEIEAPEARVHQLESMMASYRGGLKMGSMVALFVGMFIVYNTLMISVVQRRTEIGILRALGAGKSRIIAMFVGEALLLSAAGSALGCLLGLGVARGATDLVTTTVTSLYTAFPKPAIRMEPSVFWEAIALGVTVGCVAALMPAWSAARVDPVRAMRRGEPDSFSGRRLSRALVPALFLFLGAAMVLHFRPLSRPADNGYAALLGVLTGFMLLVPTVVRFLGRLLTCRLARLLPIEGRIAGDSLSRSARRNAVTSGAFLVGVATLVSLVIYLHSFKTTVDEWIRCSLTADLFVSNGSPLPGPEALPIPEELVAEFQQDDRIEEVCPVRLLRIPYRGHRVMLTVCPMETLHRRATARILQGERAEVARALAEGEPIVLASENMAQRYELRAGESIELATPAGPRSFRVAAVIQDYTSDHGNLTMDWQWYLEGWNDPRIDFLDCYLKDPSQAEEVKGSLLDTHGEQCPLFVSTNRELRDIVSRILDQSFQITYALQIAALIVALLGVVNTLMASILDRTRELGVLRAVGTTRAQLVKIVLAEGAGLGVLGTAMGFVAGAVMAWVSVTAMNRILAGWSSLYVIPPGKMAVAMAIFVAVSLGAGLYPAWRAARLRIVEALSYE